ncbi:MAG: sigma-70 family RNA polymerase sigma factor [Pseudomonadota bacterium]
MKILFFLIVVLSIIPPCLASLISSPPASALVHDEIIKIQDDCSELLENENKEGESEEEENEKSKSVEFAQSEQGPTDEEIKEALSPPASNTELGNYVSGEEGITSFFRWLHIIVPLEIEQMDVLFAERDRLRKIPLSDRSAEDIKSLDKIEMRLAEGNLGLVAFTIKKWPYLARLLPYLDCFNEGVPGLQKAIGYFDRTRGYRFSTYALWHIRAAIQRAVDKQARTIRLPTGQIDLVNQIMKATNKLYDKFKRNPTYKEVAISLGLSALKVESLMKIHLTPASLNAPIDGFDELTLADTIPDDRNNDGTLDGGLDTQKLHLYGDQFMQTITPNKKIIFERRVFLRNSTLEEIAMILGITPERVRQLERRITLDFIHFVRKDIGLPINHANDANLPGISDRPDGKPEKSITLLAKNLLHHQSALARENFRSTLTEQEKTLYDIRFDSYGAGPQEIYLAKYLGLTVAALRHEEGQINNKIQWAFGSGRP